MSEQIIAGKFKQGNKIGAGSFGEISRGISILTGEAVAIKQEDCHTKHPQLIYESKVMKLLAGGLGVPEIHWYGTEGVFNAMVLDLLGPSLEDLFNYCNHKFSLKTTLMIIDQIICRIEYVHSKSFIHRDIKPDNFLIGTGKRCTIVYIIDFGLSKKYRDLTTGMHIGNSTGKSLTGTARYASVNAHKGNEQSRRDDLEAVGYVMLYFLNGSLPWQGINAKTRDEKYRLIKNKKTNANLDELCKGLPEGVKMYFTYLKSLKFEECPNYRYIRSLLKDMFAEGQFVYDYQFDWTVMGHPAARMQKEKKKINGYVIEIKEEIKEERGIKVYKEEIKEVIKEESKLDDLNLVFVTSSKIPMQLEDEPCKENYHGRNGNATKHKQCNIF